MVKDGDIVFARVFFKGLGQGHFFACKVSRPRKAPLVYFLCKKPQYSSLSAMVFFKKDVYLEELLLFYTHLLYFYFFYVFPSNRFYKNQ